MQTDRIKTAIDRLRTALEASRIPHLRVPGDPWFNCPIAQREDSSDPSDYPDAHCGCGADKHNARIDAVLADPDVESETERLRSALNALQELIHGSYGHDINGRDGEHFEDCFVCEADLIVNHALAEPAPDGGQG